MRCSPATTGPIWTRTISVGPVLERVRSRSVGLVVGLGIALRLIEFAYNRPLWLDEGSLVACIGQVDRVGLFGPLGATQLAPPGFLAAEWLVTRLLGTSPLAYRLVPLMAGIAALLLFRVIARRSLASRGELLAVLLFALTDDLIYYSAEVKQYASDLALSLAVLVLAGRVNDRVGLGVARSGLIRLGCLGAVLVWCSHPLAFTLAAVGTVGVIGATRRRDLPALGCWVAIGLIWVASLLSVRAVGMRQLGHRGDMWAFWRFAFPPWPVASVWDATWPIRRGVYLFVDPLDCHGTLGSRWSVGAAVILALVGSVRLGRSQPWWLATLLVPGAFALLAATLRIYPFHGRLTLGWAPLLLIPVAAGFDAVGARWLRWLLIVGLVGGPVLVDAGHLLGPRHRFELNPFGDRRPASLDPNYYPWSAPEPERQRAHR